MYRVQKNYIYFKQKSFLSLLIILMQVLLKKKKKKSFEPKVLNRSVILKSAVHLKMFYTYIKFSFNLKKHFCLEHLRPVLYNHFCLDPQISHLFIKRCNVKACFIPCLCLLTHPYAQVLTNTLYLLAVMLWLNFSRLVCNFSIWLSVYVCVHLWSFWPVPLH